MQKCISLHSWSGKASSQYCIFMILYYMYFFPSNDLVLNLFFKIRRIPAFLSESHKTILCSRMRRLESQPGLSRVESDWERRRLSHWSLAAGKPLLRPVYPGRLRVVPPSCRNGNPNSSLRAGRWRNRASFWVVPTTEKPAQKSPTRSTPGDSGVRMCGRVGAENRPPPPMRVYIEEYSTPISM